MSSLVILRIMNVMKQLSSPLTNEDNIKATNLFKLVAQSSMGPKGCLKMLQNTCGGLVTITSSSHRLLTVLKFSNPYNRLVAAALVNHLKLYDNDGLYLIFLTLEQLNRSMKLGIQPSLISAVCQKLQHSLVNHLETCSLKLQVNFDNLDLLLALTKSILTSKPACGLNEKQRNHLAYLLLRYFLNSVPQSESIDEKVGTFHFITESGLSLDHCQLFEGLLIEVYDAKNIQTVSGLQKCALFHISLSGDVETSLSDEKWTIHDNFNIVDSCTKHVMEICAQVVSEGVSLVACQKVIHPRAKKYLTNYGIIVLDRLGQLSFQALQELTGVFVSVSDISFILKSHHSFFKY